MWTNPGFSRAGKKKKKKRPWGKIWQDVNLIFLFVSSIITFGVCIRNFIYIHNYQYDIKST